MLEDASGIKLLQRTLQNGHCPLVSLYRTPEQSIRQLEVIENKGARTYVTIDTYHRLAM